MSASSSEPRSDRGTLGFPTLVLENSGFLTKRYGFRCVRARKTIVVFRNQRVELTFYHGRSSYEIGVEFSLITGDDNVGKKVTLQDLLAFHGLPSNAGYYQASNRRDLLDGVRKITSLIQEHGHELLNGAADSFSSIIDLQNRESRQYVTQVNDRQTRIEAERAWKQRVYSRVINLYESLEGRLTDVETRRLQYARKKISGAE